MTPERWRQIETVYESVVDLPPEVRHDKLADLCGTDRTLQDEVETLIESTGGASDSLRRAVASEANRLFSSSNQQGRRLGTYRLLELIGEGGMGAVFRAMRIDAEFKRVVAIKILHRGLCTTHAAARFRDERQILATLDHPGIVKLLDGGSTDDGLPYLVMEHLEGAPITRFARDHALSTRKRVELFAKVCAAVQYAHQMLVIHRDLKPSNIIVDTAGEPKLLDFGIAKLLDEGASREAQTRTGASMLTPEYASPEQARGEPVATASDVYSLGAVLYDLLADRPPHKLADSALESLRLICETEPARPSMSAPVERRATIAGDLDNIVLKALQKEPARRYASVAQLADDLQRYLDGLPVKARTATLGYRAGKFVRRHSGKLAIAAVVTAALTTTMVASVQQAQRADAQAKRADAEARRAKQRFEETRKLAGALLFELDDKIRDLAGATAARKLVVSRALEYLDVLSDETDADLDTQLDLAFAYMKVGDIQGNGDMPNLGLARDGLISYIKAASIINRLNALGYSSKRLRDADSELRFGIGTMQLSLVQPHAARETLRSAVDYFASLNENAQPSLELQLRANQRLAHVVTDPDEFRKYSEASLALAKRWADTGSHEGRYWYGTVLLIRGNAFAIAGEPERAVEHDRHAADVLTRLAADHPDDVRYAREVGIGYAMVAWHSAGVGNASIWQPSIDDQQAAERASQMSVDVFDRLVKHDAEDARMKIDHGTVIGAQAGVIARRDPLAAIPVFERSLAVFASLSPTQRDSPYSLQNEWFSHCAMAEPLARAGRRADAVRAIERGLEITNIVEKDVRDAPIVSMCHYLTARAYEALGQRARAIALLEHAAKDLAAHANEGGLERRIGFTDVMRRLATLRPAQACDLLGRARALWKQWPGAVTEYVQHQQNAIDRDLKTACR